MDEKRLMCDGVVVVAKVDEKVRDVLNGGSSSGVDPLVSAFLSVARRKDLSDSGSIFARSGFAKTAINTQ